MLEYNPLGGGGVDADALAFITAASITDNTQKSAINTLVTQLKTYGIWTKMKAVYPFVGGNASAHKFNLKDPRDSDAAFRLVFNGGWTHTSTGAKPNGTTAFADTKLAPNVMAQNNIHASFYSRTDIDGYYWDLGAYNAGGGVVIGLRYQSGYSLVYMNTKSADSVTDNNPTIGLYMGNRTSSTSNTLFRNGVKIVNGSKSSFAPISLNIYLGAGNYNGTSDAYSPREQAFASIGDGLSDTEAANFYTAVQTFQTTLGRQVGVPIVADTDAQAFLNAAIITDQTQANAITTLVTDLKSANIWTKMKALYPFVGGTASSHKFNLKDPRDLDAAYRLVFNGGWTHSTTGALPNGTNGYADTKLIPSSNLNLNSVHLSTYLRTNTTGNYADMGAISSIGSVSLQLLSKWSDNKFYAQMNDADFNDNTVANSLGLFIGNRSSSTSVKSFKNTTTITNKAASSVSLPNNYIFLGGRASTVGLLQSPSNREQAFASIGDGLTDAEVLAFYNAVQTFQTTLGRQV